jgi:plastocyanin
VFRVKLADTVPAGTYHYYCVIHFPDMQGTVVVKPKTSSLPSATDDAKRANSEIKKLSVPLEKAFAAASKSDQVRTAGEESRVPIAGFHTKQRGAAIDAFLPRTLHTTVNKKVTWTIAGAHTVSFGVPKGLEIFTVSKDGTVKRNPKVDEAAGGSPSPPPVDFRRSTYTIDGGTYDGSGFYSSGLLGSSPYSVYSLRFSKAGTYRYACLVHPPMIGTVVVAK